MTTYTMNGHSHPTMQVEPEILMGMVGNQVAQFTRAQWRMRRQPEKFSCLDSPEPRIQLQEALKQIEMLLHKNSQLLETVFLLSQALNEAHSLIHENAAISQPDRDKLHLSHDFHRCLERQRGEIRS